MSATTTPTAPAPTARHIAVTGMSCAACVMRVEKALARVPGVDGVTVDLVGHAARVTGSADDDALAAALDAAGYGLVREAGAGAGAGGATVSARVAALEARERAEAKALDRDLAAALALGVPVIALGMAHGLVTGMGWLVVQAVLTIALAAWPGRRFFVEAARLLAARGANMSTLVALGVASALGYSLAMLALAAAAGDLGDHRGHPGHAAAAPHVYFEAAAAIVVFVLVGKRLEARARRDLSSAVRGLVSLVPERVQRLDEDADGLARETTTPTAALALGDVVRVRAGGRVPIDGEVVAGLASIDESALTGESVPVTRELGARVHAGTLVAGGAIDVRVAAAGEATALGQIALAVEEARSDKAPIARVADRVAGVFVPVVVALAVVTLIVHLALGADGGDALERFVTVVIIACPCALGLATPAAVAVGAGRAAELGVLVKGGATLEALAKVDTVVLDKTGTLTRGAPEVVAVRTLAAWSEREVLAAAAIVERASDHPLARAIVAHAARVVGDTSGSDLGAARDLVTAVGGGVRATIVVDGRTTAIAVGAEAFVDDRAAFAEATRVFADAGATPVCVSLDGRAAGVIALRDAPREEAKATVAELAALGLEVVVLSGDRPAVVATVASEVGVGRAEGGLTPEGKRRHIVGLRERGRTVAMVGDGVNDAPALAAADVGVALRSGTDIAAGSADVVLSRGGLGELPLAFTLARKTMRLVHQNLFWAFAYNVVGIPLAAGVFVPLLGWSLDPMYASLAMALSSVSVVTNALRARRGRR